MKAGKYIFLLVVLLTGSAMAQEKKVSRPDIHFLNKDWNSVLALSKKMRKPIFVDAYTSWCAPCQEMKQKTFTDRGIATSFNKRFISITIDVEKGEGVEFADHYQVNAYPTLLFINSNGQLIKRLEGFMDAKQLTAAAAGIK